jgi:hypothetical protein
VKNLFWIFAVLLLIVSAGACGNLFAEAAGPVQAGVAGSVKGEVKATTPPEKTAHPLKNGDSIFMGDKIETGAEGQLQILLLDQTVFNLGPLSTIMVDEFIYDPSKAGAKAGMVKGIFRAVSGKVAQRNPEDEPGGGPDQAETDTELSSPQAQEDALELAELIGTEDAANTFAARSGKPSESQKQQI